MKNVSTPHHTLWFFLLVFISVCISLLCLLGVQPSAYAAGDNSNRYAGPVLTTGTQTSSTVQGWKYLNKNWYYYGSNGLPVTGIKELPRRYKDTNGMWQSDNIWTNGYYFNSAGVMQTGWQKVKGSWYYFEESSGEMVRSRGIKIDKTVYVFTASGALATKSGWIKLSSRHTHTTDWYYVKNKSGHAQTGWKRLSGKWYYFNPGWGEMYSSGGFQIGNQSYLFSKSGALVTKTGWQKIKYSESYTEWYYVKNSSGHLQRGWKEISGKWYYFRDYSDAIYNGGLHSGSMFGGGVIFTNGQNQYYLDKSGAMKTGWIKYGGKWYYFAKNGAMFKNKWVGNYWLGCDGVMATNQWVDNGRYYVDKNGKWVKGKKR